MIRQIAAFIKGVVNVLLIGVVALTIAGFALAMASAMEMMTKR